MNVTIGQFLGITPESVAQVRDYTMVLGIPSLQTGVFGGIIIRIIAAGCINAITASSFLHGWSSSPASDLCR